jgi:hypothetical protein
MRCAKSRKSKRRAQYQQSGSLRRRSWPDQHFRLGRNTEAPRARPPAALCIGTRLGEGVGSTRNRGCRYARHGALSRWDGGLLRVPHSDSDDRRAQSDRELVCGRRRAYAPDATGRGRVALPLFVQLGRLRCGHPDGRSPAGASVSAMFATTTTGVPLARKARAWLELGAARQDALPCRARGGRARHQPSVPDYVATGIAQARAVVARRSVGRRQTSRSGRARPDPHQALLVKLGAPALVQNAGGEPAPHEGTLVANMLVGHG